MVEIPAQAGPSRQPGHSPGGRHRRAEADVLRAVACYEMLTVVLRRHQPGERAGLCQVCGTGWPCAEVLLPLENHRLSSPDRYAEGGFGGELSRAHR